MDGATVVPVDVGGAAEDVMDGIWVVAVVGSLVVLSVFVSVSAPITNPAWNIKK